MEALIGAAAMAARIEARVAAGMIVGLAAVTSGHAGALCVLTSPQARQIVQEDGEVAFDLVLVLVAELARLLPPYNAFTIMLARSWKAVLAE